MAQAIGFDLNVWQCLGCGGDPCVRARFKKITTYRRGLIRTAKKKWEAATDFKSAVRQSCDQILEMF